MSTPYTPTPAPLPATLDLPEDGVEEVVAETVNTNTAILADAIAHGTLRSLGTPSLIIDSTVSLSPGVGDWPPNVRSAIAIAIGGGCGGSGGASFDGGGGGGGSGYVSPLVVVDLTGATSIAFTIGAGGAGGSFGSVGSAGGTTTADFTYGMSVRRLQALGASPTSGQNSGGDGYSGGGAGANATFQGGHGGTAGGSGQNVSGTGVPGIGIVDIVGGGFGWQNAGGGGGVGGTEGGGGGGGGAGYWPGILAENGADGTGTDPGLGGGGGAGYGAGGGGGGELGTAGANGAGGAGANGAVLIWWIE